MENEDVQRQTGQTDVEEVIPSSGEHFSDSGRLLTIVITIVCLYGPVYTGVVNHSSYCKLCDRKVFSV